MLLKESVDMKINTSVCIKKNNLMEDEGKDKVQREQTYWNLKRHIPAVNLFLCCKMMDVHCFVWS